MPPKPKKGQEWGTTKLVIIFVLVVLLPLGALRYFFGSTWIWVFLGVTVLLNVVTYFLDRRRTRRG